MSATNTAFATATARTVTVDIDSIGAGGVGVARSDGRVVFVPRTAPGDEVEVVLAPADAGARFFKGRLARVITPGPSRATPRCPHFVADDCGGCQLQHIDGAAQSLAKAGIIRDAFQRIAKRPLATEPEVRTGSSPWRYRRSLSVHLRPLGEGRWLAGFHAYHTPGAIFKLDDCLITREVVVRAIAAVVAAGVHLPTSDGLRVTARETQAGVALLVEGADRWSDADATALLTDVPALSAVWWHPHRGRRRLMADRRSNQAPGASFAQTNADVAALLRAHLLQRVRALTPRTVVDAYAGVGDTAIPLAREGVKVTAIEIDAEASRWCASQLPAGSTAVVGRTEVELPRALPADVVIVNPPRDGLAADVTRLLDAASGTRALFYVSCNPATLARDVARLSQWHVSHLLAFDMFPQTAHVETVCELRPGSTA